MQRSFEILAPRPMCILCAYKFGYTFLSIIITFKLSKRPKLAFTTDAYYKPYIMLYNI